MYFYTEIYVFFCIAINVSALYCSLWDFCTEIYLIFLHYV